ncbi:MAG: M23 family metallopeptidase [Patescibacteria group bacterium]
MRRFILLLAMAITAITALYPFTSTVQADTLLPTLTLLQTVPLAQTDTPADVTAKPAVRSTWGAIKALYRAETAIEQSPTQSTVQKPGAGTMAAAPSWCWNWKFPFCGSWQISCKYGCFLHTGQDQYAIDWNLPGNSDLWQPVFAPASGWQVWSGRYGAYGNSVVVYTGNSTYYRLAHMVQLRWPYQTRYVYQGQTIGWCGGTGVTDTQYPPHIHFSVHYPATYAGSGKISGSSVPQEGISNQWTLNTGAYYPSGQTCQSW